MPRARSLEPDTGAHAKLTRQGIRPDLEVHDFALGPFPAFDVPYEVGAVIRPEPSAFPSAVRVVDAAVHAARIEAERIGNAELDPFFRLRVERQQRIRIGSRRERRVRTEARDVGA